MKRHLLTLFALCVSLFLFAYDAIGHRIVADIAYEHLNKKTRKKVDAVLGTRGIVYTAVWADAITKDSAYAHSSQWHYQNLADGMTPADIQILWENPKAEGLHLFYAVDSLTQVLKADGKNKEALKFLVHFVGDCMQPMHIGRLDDLGGNRVPITWFGQNTNIHALWDRYMLESHQYSYSEYSQYLQHSFKNNTQLAQLSLLESIQRCYQIRKEIYAYQESGGSSNYRYLHHFHQYLDECLYMGGLQLANLLNEIYR